MRSKPRSASPAPASWRSISASTSLAYALRKTRELGIGNIDYAQADILKLDTDRPQLRSDRIVGRAASHGRPVCRLARAAVGAAAGRRHGGRALQRDRARPTSSRRAPSSPSAATARAPTTSGAAARSIVAHEDGAAFKNVYASGDFFSTSDCRDLLFHVQEHRLTIPQIARLPCRQRARVHGVRGRRRRIASQYRRQVSRRHGDDRSRSLGRVRARASEHVFRHVPVLGAEGVLTPRRLPNCDRLMRAGLP